MRVLHEHVARVALEAVADRVAALAERPDPRACSSPPVSENVTSYVKVVGTRSTNAARAGESREADAEQRARLADARRAVDQHASARRSPSRSPSPCRTTRRRRVNTSASGQRLCRAPAVARRLAERDAVAEVGARAAARRSRARSTSRAMSAAGVGLVLLEQRRSPGSPTCARDRACAVSSDRASCSAGSGAGRSRRSARTSSWSTTRRRAGRRTARCSRCRWSRRR